MKRLRYDVSVRLLLLLFALLLTWPEVGFAAPKKGKITIETKPAGASVFIGDKEGGERGKTPVTLTLPVGTHTIIIEAAGYTPIFESIVVKAGRKPSKKTFTLVKAIGTLTVTADASLGKTTDDIEVFINDTSAGGLPYESELVEDAYHVVVKRGKTVLLDEWVNVAAGEHLELSAKAPTITPKPTTGDTGPAAKDPVAHLERVLAAQPRAPYVAVQAVTSILQRQVAYTNATTPNLTTLNQSGQMLVGVRLEIWPGAAMPQAARGLSLRVNAQFGLPQSFAAQDGQTVSSAYRFIDAGLHYRYKLGRWGVGGGAGYVDEALRFTAPPTALTALPLGYFRSVRGSAEVSYHHGRWKPFVAAHGHFIVDAGTYLRRFRNPTGQGLGGSAGIAARLGPALASLRVTLTRYSFAVKASPNYGASGATDQLLAIEAGLGVTF